jgi:DHA2 family multidrug resistance protein-like MFS transporter
MASYVALPFYLQHALGRGDLAIGLAMTSWPLVVAVAGPLSGRLADRVSNGLLCAAGGVFLAAGLAIAAALPPGGTLVPLECCLILGGLGFVLFQTPNNRNMLLSAPKERSGAVGGMQARARLLGQMIGSVIMALLFTITSTATAPRVGLAVAAVLALAGGLVSILRVPAPAHVE